jgi:hypothetical protein
LRTIREFDSLVTSLTRTAVRSSARIALLAATGVVTVSTALIWSRMTPTDPRDVRSVIVAEHDTLAFHVPDTVMTGVPFDVSFSTFGGGCVRAPARTAITRSPGTIIIQPYDRHIGGHACPRDRMRLGHSARVRFDTPGVNVIRVAADGRDTSSQRETTSAELVKTVLVCDCRPLRRQAAGGAELVADHRGGSRAIEQQRSEPARDSVRGISFVIDTTVFDANALPPGQDAQRTWSTFASIRARVTFAGANGRMDILWTRGGPALLIDSVASAAPLATAGDYYLFDSTSFTLVRPRTRTYTRFAISGDTYNHEGRRDGWPAFFEFAPLHIDTVTTGAPALTRSVKDVHIFWHSDMLPNVAIARGSLTLVDAPMSETNVARWFAPTRDLAHLAEAGALPTTRVTVTAAIPLGPGPQQGVPLTIILKAEFVQLRAAIVDVASLGIPAGYKETPLRP